MALVKVSMRLLEIVSPGTEMRPCSEHCVEGDISFLGHVESTELVALSRSLDVQDGAQATA